jgi:hypothetical protein
MVLVEVVMNRKDAKFKVPYKRTDKWWKGDWAEISNWCRENTIGRWDYMNEEFWFTDEQDYVWFKLRWL